MNEKMVRSNIQKLLIWHTEMLPKYVLYLGIRHMFTTKKYWPECPFSLAMSTFFGPSTLYILFSVFNNCLQWCDTQEYWLWSQDTGFEIYIRHLWIVQWKWVTYQLYCQMGILTWPHGIGCSSGDLVNVQQSAWLFFWWRSLEKRSRNGTSQRKRKEGRTGHQLWPASGWRRRHIWCVPHLCIPQQHFYPWHWSFWQGNHLPCNWWDEGEGWPRWVLTISCHK